MTEFRPAPTIPCQRCGFRAHTVSNPYFGSGLAVHEHLIVCDRCGFTTFAPTQRDDEETRPPVRPSRWNRIRRALRPDAR